MIHERVKQRRLTQKELAGAVDLSRATISRHLKTPQQFEHLGADKIDAIRVFLHGRDLKHSGTALSPIAEYLGFASVFGQTDTAKTDIVANGLGYYRVLRWSNWKRGSILQGTLLIEHDKAQGIITTKEFYSASGDGSVVNWPREGYFVGRGRTEFALISRKIASSEVQTVYFRSPTPTRSKSHPSEFATLDGMVFDMQEHKIYATAILAERVGAAARSLPVRDFTPDDPQFAAFAKRLSDLNATFSDQIYSLG